MERWSIASNSLFKKASIYHESGPWYLFFIEWLSVFICDWFPPIPLPRWTITRDSWLGDDLIKEGEVTTLQDFYGNTRDLWHIKVDDPILQWVWKKYKRNCLELNYEEAAQKFPDQIRWNDEDESEGHTDDI